MSKLTATGTRLIIEQMAASRTTASGILLQSNQEAPRARVLSVGADVKEDIKAGDILVVDWNKVGQFDFENQKYYLVDESTILAVME